MLKQKILIVAPSWVGDLVMAESLLEVLHNRYCQHALQAQIEPQTEQQAKQTIQSTQNNQQQNTNSLQIDVLASPYLLAILTRFPYVNKVIPLPFKHGEFNIKQRYLLAKKLQHENYTQAIILPNSWKSALIPFLAKIPIRTGWRGEMRYLLLNDVRVLHKQKIPLMVERFVALGFDDKKNNCNLSQNTFKKSDLLNQEIVKKSLQDLLSTQFPLPKLQITFAQVTATINKFELINQYQYNKQQLILALCIGAEYGQAKRWPTEYFAQIAQQQLAKGWQVWLFGSVKDSVLAEEIQQLTQNACVDFTGKTTLDEAVDLLSLTSLAISNDSGLMHIVSALNIPLLAIYGSSTPKFTPPLSSTAKILQLNLPCCPCFERQCPLKHFKCMLDLTPDKVINELDAMIETYKIY